jgi:hypothetical protein
MANTMSSEVNGKLFHKLVGGEGGFTVKHVAERNLFFGHGVRMLY